MVKQKVMIAMSGGVDSSVAAYLLLQQGFEVVGATLQIWPDEEDRVGGCCGWSAINDARRVANHLGIPHYVLNYRSIFKQKVVDYFCREYLAGRTPNPCIACNRFVKFGALVEQARALEIDFVATGHYARIKWDEKQKRYLLYKGADRHKDQSYVLYNLTQEQLSHLLFPLGEITKNEVRNIARKLNIPVGEKPESQEICFIPDNDYGRFVSFRYPEHVRPGPIKDVHGQVIGKHKGIAYYTIGQRRKLGIATGEPMYVIALDPTTNSVIVGGKSQVFSSSCAAIDVNFIAIDRLETKLEVEAKIRYTATPVKAVIAPGPNQSVKVLFKQPVRAITPGQAVVFYQGELVIGGGTICLV